MTWADTIQQLEFYTHDSNIFPCWGDKLFSPSDLILQGQVPQVANNNYNIQIVAYSTNGITSLGDITSYFNFYFGQNTNGGYYFNAQLKTFPSLLTPCFVLNVIVSTSVSPINIIFNKWTQRFDLVDTSGCVVAYDVTIKDVSGLNIARDCSPAPAPDACGNSYLRLLSYFDCMDDYSGEFYGLPVNTYYNNCTPFTYYKVTWLNLIKRFVPLEIKRTTSINCRLQKTEKQRSWLFANANNQGVPVYKAIEIEEMLYADHIFMDGTEYAFQTGGTVFKELSKCVSHYRLDITLQECYQFQLSGCTNECS